MCTIIATCPLRVKEELLLYRGRTLVFVLASTTIQSGAIKHLARFPSRAVNAKQV